MELFLITSADLYPTRQEYHACIYHVHVAGLEMLKNSTAVKSLSANHVPHVRLANR